MYDDKVFVGWDYHEDLIQVCVLDANGEVLGERRLPNDHRRVVKYVDGFDRRVHVAVEVGTGSSALADIPVNEAGWIVDLAHPGYVHRLMRFDPRWPMFAAHQRRAGQPTNVIVAAVANRWIRGLYHQMQPEMLAA